MNESILTIGRVLAAGMTKPSYAGNRTDGKVCSAKQGECRFRYEHYTIGMNDEKSWSLPIASQKCSCKCLYLILQEG